MNYKNYIKSRNASWKILLNCGCGRMPVDVFDICNQLKIKAISYENVKGRLIIDMLGIKDITDKTDGICVKILDSHLILYSERTSKQRQRFTVAHEIGHIVIGHQSENSKYISRVNEEMGSEADEKEKQANVFASRLLAPACVLWLNNVRTAEDISRLCDISITAAQYRMERMRILYKRNMFLTHPLERDLYDRFRKTKSKK